MILQTIKLFQNDIEISGGKTAVLTDADALAQILSNRLKMWLGEWIVDQTQGVDYMSVLTSKIFFSDRFNKMITTELLKDPRVTRVINLSLDLDAGGGALVGSYTIDTTFGILTIGL